MKVAVCDPSKEESTPEAWGSEQREAPLFQCYETRSPAPEDEARISHWATTLRDLSALMLPYFFGMYVNSLLGLSCSFCRILYSSRTFLALQPSQPKAHWNRH